jgi:hypothetical protein
MTDQPEQVEQLLLEVAGPHALICRCAGQQRARPAGWQEWGEGRLVPPLLRSARASSPPRLVLCAALLAMPLVVGSTASGGVSSVCGPGRTALGGSLQGADGAALNATVNVELTNADTTRGLRRVPPTPRRHRRAPAGSRYSYVDHVNPALEQRSFGDQRVRLDRTWGAPRAGGVLCFTSNARIAQAYVEIYRAGASTPTATATSTDTSPTARGTAQRRTTASRCARVETTPGSSFGCRRTSHRRSARSSATPPTGRAVPVAANACGTSGRPACNGITTVRAFPQTQSERTAASRLQRER